MEALRLIHEDGGQDGLLLNQFGDIARRDLGRRIVRPHGGGGHHVDCRGELVVNPMGQFVDKGPFIQAGAGVPAVLVTTIAYIYYTV
jgi:hypothetical protein